MCRFDPASPSCTPCLHYADCWDEHATLSVEPPRTDAQLRPIIPRSRHRKRRDRWQRIPRGATNA